MSRWTMSTRWTSASTAAIAAAQTRLGGAAHGWRADLIRDRHGEPAAIDAVHIGSTWTDAVAIEGEDRTVAIRTRTKDDGRLILPNELPGISGAVWFRDGRCEDVLAELFELPEERPP